MGFWKKNSVFNHAPTSVIDHGCLAEGRLQFVGVLALNGQFRGELLSSDTLLVGEKGEAEAAVQAGVAIISGQIRGNITARERVELRSTARIYGNIVTPVLVLEEGVVIDGQCKTSLENDSESDGYK
jgi:cytoskeletal protein CcmA (bactofilin family)